MIDDDPLILRELVPVLHDDFELTHALDGCSGLCRAQVQRPDLILLDVLLPGTDGHAVCRLLKADAATREIPLIFLSGLDFPEQRPQGFALGAVDYVGKPFNAAEVRARIDVHLRLAAGPVPAEAPCDAEEPSAALQVRAAMQYITRQLADSPSVSEIAERVGTREVRLLALFRQELGLTVSGFIAEERVRVGCRLLAQTQMRVQEVACEVGYSGPGNFIGAFKERMGVTPQGLARDGAHRALAAAGRSAGIGLSEMSGGREKVA